MKNKLILVGVVVMLLIALVGGIVYLAFHNNSAIAIEGYYDANGNRIDKSQVMINGQSGVQYIKLKVMATNKDNINLDFEIIEASPAEFEDVLTLNSKQTANPGNSVTWVSGLIDLNPFADTTTDFCANVRASATGRQSADKNNCLSLTIAQDPTSNFEVSVGPESTSNDPETPPLPPEEDETPEEPNVDFQTNAVFGSYSNYKSGTWVRVDANNDNVLEQFTYSSLITAGACPGTAKTTTPEGYVVKIYTGSSGTNSVTICNPSGAGYKRYA